MVVWKNDELDKIGAAEELKNAVLRPDGTLRKAVTIWVVRVGDDLYIRSYNGSQGAWYGAARASHKGRIQAGGVEVDVNFIAERDPRINDQIDAAYSTKYGRYPQYVAPMMTADVRSTTMKLVPDV